MLRHPREARSGHLVLRFIERLRHAFPFLANPHLLSSFSTEELQCSTCACSASGSVAPQGESGAASALKHAFLENEAAAWAAGQNSLLSGSGLSTSGFSRVSPLRIRNRAAPAAPPTLERLYTPLSLKNVSSAFSGVNSAFLKPLSSHRCHHLSTAAQVASPDPPPSDTVPSWESGPPFARSRSQSNSFYDVTVEKYAAKPLSTLTLKKMLSFGENAKGDQLERKIIRSAQFVQNELRVRLAKRLLDLQLLPYIVVTNPHIKRVYDAYHRAFLVLKDFPEVTNMEQNQYLTGLLTKLVDEHAPLVTSLAKGLRECTTRPLVGPSLTLDPFLDSMLRSRISRRVIAEQHICFQQRREGYIGVICTELSVAQILGAAIARTEQVCRDTYGTHPPFHVTGDADTVFSYIPAHLDYMFFEILKNASRAVVEHQSRIASSRGARVPLLTSAMPPIVVQVCKGTKEVTIKISDQGGGIDEEVQPKIWKYGYTSVDPTAAPGDSPASSMADFRTGAAMDPMAGLGFGLPVSRLYAQYFGGNIEMMSIPGYGTDVYLRIHRLGNQSEYVEI